jgi:hypothetical protein
MAIMFRLRWLRSADGIGCGETADQTGFKSRVSVLIGQHRFAGIGGVFVMCRRVEFLS